jgi:predicted AAA+ superfamily ATPase
MPELPHSPTLGRYSQLFPRAIAPLLLEALQEARIVAVIGPRQAGKTTLVRDLIRADYPATYVTLDDAGTRSAAESDPTGLVAQMLGPTIVDEIQRAPDLLLSIKERVDRDDRPGQFLITGSANIQTLPTIRDALPGRIEYVWLWPFAQSEIEGGGGNLVDSFFSGSVPTAEGVNRQEMARRIAAGGFPSAFKRQPRSRARFFEGYLDSIVGRDVPDIARTRNPTTAGKLLRLLAARSGSLLRRESLAGAAGVDRKTVEHHLRILEDLMLVRIHDAWHINLSKREIKTPKTYITDTGMLTALIGASPERVATDPDVAGMSFETFVVMELVKLSSWAEDAPRLFHYRDRDNREVDSILERSDGRIVGVEVKAAATAMASDFKALAFLRDKLGKRFCLGIVMYAGARSLPFGDRLFAVPLTSLWS